MVVGISPSIVKTGFVSAILNAGFHLELVCRGHYNVAAVHAKVAEIQGQIPAGVGISPNSLSINPHQFRFQFPLWQDVCRNGLPVKGLPVTADIPSTS